MFTALRSAWSAVRRRASGSWFPLSQIPEGFFGLTTPGAVRSPEQALTLSAFFSGIRLYQTTVGSLPLLTYQRLADDGRERASQLPVYRILKQRPNRAQTRNTFFQFALKEMILGRGFFCHVRKTGEGYLEGLYPIPSHCVEEIQIDDEWNKLYRVRFNNRQVEWYTDREMVHCFMFSLDGIRGCSLLDFAGESLGVHRQVLKTAGAVYRNAARPSGYIRYKGRLNEEAIAKIKSHFRDEYAGVENTGKIPVLTEDSQFEALPYINAEDARILEALGAGVDDIARWLNISPLLLFNLARGTYSNLGSENASFYQRTIRPVLDLLELELNWKIFGPDSPLYCEFQVEHLLRGDPREQAEVANIGIQNGSITRNEQRDMLNRPRLPGLDEPLTPMNMTGGTPPETNDDSTGE